jgi:hypothetical protein
MLDDRIKKAIKFFREFAGSSDKELYRRSVLKFTDLVEERLFPKEDLIEAAKEIFKEEEASIETP